MNAWSKFRALIPADPLLVGAVTAHHLDGTSSVQLPGSITIRVRGQAVAVGLKAFVQTGRIVGEAPDLPSFTVAV